MAGNAAMDARWTVDGRLTTDYTDVLDFTDGEQEQSEVWRRTIRDSSVSS
jgi:hypothetical protein